VSDLTEFNGLQEECSTVNDEQRLLSVVVTVTYCNMRVDEFNPILQLQHCEL